MGKRREGRLLAVQFLYQNDLRASEDVSVELDKFWEMVQKKSLRKYADEFIRGVLEHVDELDKLIIKYAQNWNLNRMAPVDRNVLRLALYEMHYREDIPPVVSINEAIEIAKRLSTEESGKFVNGILDRAKQDLNREFR